MPNQQLAYAYEPNHHLLQSDAPALSDEELVRRIHVGAVWAEHVLAQKYQPQIKRVGRMIGADAALCEDLVQEALLKVIQNLRNNRLKDATKLEAYVNQTARFTYYGWQRNKNSQVEMRGSLDDTKHSNNVELEYMNFSNRLWVMQQIEQLPMWRDRQILLRFYMNHQNKKEICEAMDLAPDQFDKLISRARQRLKKNIDSMFA